MVKAAVGIVLLSLLSSVLSVSVDIGQCACNCASNSAGSRRSTLSSMFDKKDVTFRDTIRGQKGEFGRAGDVGPVGEQGQRGEVGLRGPSAIDLRKNIPGATVSPSCNDIMSLGGATSGVYRIKPRGSTNKIQVYCDMESAGGGWTLVASIHENNIYGKCTVGDNWSSDQGYTNISATTNWESFKTFGHPEAATSGDYKSPAYFSLTGDNVMVMHVPNDVEMSQWNANALLQYYTNNNFLSSYGGTLQTLYSKYFPMKYTPLAGEEARDVRSLATTMVNGLNEVRRILPSFYNYNYDGASNNYISDGGNDMYDGGNKVYYKIGDGDFTQIIYEKKYSDLPTGVQVYSVKSHPFIMLMWISNPGAVVERFEMKVTSGTGADNGGSFASYTDTVTQGNVTCKYHSFNVYRTSDPSICEVYYYCGNVERWNSVLPSAFSKTSWSTSTDNLSNGVVATGNPQSILMGYFLLSRPSGTQVTAEQVRAVMERLAALFDITPRVPDLNCARLNESLAVPVSYIRGNNSAVMARVPPTEKSRVDAGFLHFRALDRLGNPNALCPGVKSLSCQPQSLCVGGAGIGPNSTEIQRRSCGDFSGWAGNPSDNATLERPAGSARPLSDLASSILIFTR